ncbi:MAG TPA: hypothetical protein VG756_07960 [Pseudonocardiaceae bacterium]|jgi:hypothetical protein|nr:hypothetical protein [Pseudonocardiaceae bacterium]
MQPTGSSQPSGLPIGAFPATDRLAIDEPYTRMWFDLITRSSHRIRNMAAGFGVLALIFLGLAVTAPDDFNETLTSALLAGTVVVLLAWVINVRWRRVADSVYPRMAWRAAEATVLRSRRTVVTATLDEEHIHLRVPRARLAFRQIVARSHRIWLCGPDERGRVMVRLDGLSLGVLAKVIAPPAGATPVTPVAAPTARPVDEPVLAWLLRRQNRAFTIALACCGLLVVGGALVLASTTDGTAPGVGLLPLVYGLLMAALVLSGRRRVRQAPNLIASVSGWTPVPVRLDAWQTGGRVFGPARGAIWLPDGTAVLLSVPRAGIDLVANVQASHTLWIAGAPRPGAVVAVGVPGYPIIGLARLG